MQNFKLNNYQEIENELLADKIPIQNFPKSIDFPFPENYKHIITQIKTTEISADYILFSSVEAVNETKEFVDKTFWCFGCDGQGNRWLFDESGMVFYYDHDYDEGFDAMNITFEQWLQMADLAKQMDDFIDREAVTKSIKNDFQHELNLIHPDLSGNYPYKI
ncbi:hypothetical protein [Empedobacter sedimenti]|uniref:hypothetical protein n=1 Tax=Empedobacter sedimenti TaxID=3042610 RepID=UPI0024A6A97E|nr:hypothetical protein [Empedobacter sedimenti]